MNSGRLPGAQEDVGKDGQRGAGADGGSSAGGPGRRPRLCSRAAAGSLLTTFALALVLFFLIICSFEIVRFIGP